MATTRVTGGPCRGPIGVGSRPVEVGDDRHEERGVEAVGHEIGHRVAGEDLERHLRVAVGEAGEGGCDDAAREAVAHWRREDGSESRLELRRLATTYAGRASWLLTARDVTSEFAAHAREQELANAIAQVGEIARLRIADLVDGD